MLPVIISQIVVAVVIVGLYHLWVTARKGTPVATAPPPPAATPPLQPVALVPQPQPALPTPPQPAISVQPVAKEVEPEIVAVIAAAIAVVLGRPHRVVSVQQTAQAPQVSVWALEGRVEHFQSHKFR